MNRILCGVLIVIAFGIGHWLGYGSGIKEKRDGLPYWGPTYFITDPNQLLDIDFGVPGTTVIGVGPMAFEEEISDFTIENCTFEDINPNNAINIF